MSYDPQKKVFMPDFQADNRLPSWQPGIGGDDSTAQNAGAIGGAFKQRLMQGDKGVPIDEGYTAPVSDSVTMGHEAGQVLPGAGAAKGGASGGGMFKSLG